MESSSLRSAGRLFFDEKAHSYSLDGEIVPSVTRIAHYKKNSFRFVKKDTLENAKQRGTLVHDAIRLSLHGVLDELSLPEEILPYFYAFKNFMEDFKPQPILIEQPICSFKYRYAGMLDLFASISSGYVLVDWKTGAAVPEYNSQAGGYLQALMEVWPDEKEISRIMDSRIIFCHLTKNGRYNTVEYYPLDSLVSWFGQLSFYRKSKGGNFEFDGTQQTVENEAGRGAIPDD